jgi:hypothetical protein
MTQENQTMKTTIAVRLIAACQASYKGGDGNDLTLTLVP